MVQQVAPDHRLLKAVVIVLGILLVVGFGALMAAIVIRSVSPREAEPSVPVSVVLPANARIVDLALDGDGLALRIEGANGETIVVIDLTTGRIRREIAIARETSPQIPSPR